MANGIHSTKGLYISVEEIEEVHQSIDTITTELINGLISCFNRMNSYQFYKSGEAYDEFLGLFTSLSLTMGNGLMVAEPNLFGAVSSLSTYYELIQTYADFALEQYQTLDTEFANKLKEFETSKEELYGTTNRNDR